MAGDYIIQKAVEMDKVKKGCLKPLDYYVQQSKYDGCCAILTFDQFGVFKEARSRTGEPAISMNEVGWSMANTRNFVNCAVIGEAWWPGEGQFNKISGEFRRQKLSPYLMLVINDCIPLEDFNAGYCAIPWRERIAPIVQCGNGLGSRAMWARTDPPGTFDPQLRCNELVSLGGYDGLILRDPNGTWTVGRGTTGEIIKVKQKLSFDLRVLEVNEVVGEKTGRAVYKLVVDFRGKPLGVGSGMPHKAAECPTVGDIVEVEALGLSADGLLREPRYKGVRFDKTEPD